MHAFNPQPKKNLRHRILMAYPLDRTVQRHSVRHTIVKRPENKKPLQQEPHKYPLIQQIVMGTSSYAPKMNIETESYTRAAMSSSADLKVLAERGPFVQC